MVVGFEPEQPGEPAIWSPAGKTVATNEAVADVKTGFQLGDTIRIPPAHDYKVVGLTGRWSLRAATRWSSFRSRDAQSPVPKGQRRHSQRARPHHGQSTLNRPGVPGLLNAILASQNANHNVNAVLVQIAPGSRARTCGE